MNEDLERQKLELEIVKLKEKKKTSPWAYFAAGFLPGAIAGGLFSGGSD